MLRSLEGTSDEKMINYRARIQSIVDQQHRSSREDRAIARKMEDRSDSLLGDSRLIDSTYTASAHVIGTNRGKARIDSDRLLRRRNQRPLSTLGRYHITLLLAFGLCATVRGLALDLGGS